MLSIAGLWDDWKDITSGEPLLSCTMIVTEANEFAGCVHDRMPVFLAGDSFEAWLDGSAGIELLRPAPDNLLHVWPVSKRVNRSGTGGDDFHPYRSHRQLILAETFGFASGIFDHVKNYFRRFQ